MASQGLTRVAPPDRNAVGLMLAHVKPDTAHPDGAESSPRAAALMAVLCALGLIALAAAAGKGPLPIDVAIRDGLAVGGPVPFLLGVLNTIGGALVWDAGVLIVIATLVLAHRRVEAAWIGGGLLVGEAVSTVIKLVVDRPRPPGIAVVDLVTQASFPSGHVTRAALTGALLVLFWPGGPRSRIVAAIAAFVVAALMGLARIVAGEHWPTDVLGAYLVVGMVTAGAAAIRMRLSRMPAPGHPNRPVPAPDDAARSP